MKTFVLKPLVINMGLFFPIIGGAFCLVIIVLGVYAFSALFMGFLGGLIMYLIIGRKDIAVLHNWMIIITFFISLCGIIWFINLF